LSEAPERAEFATFAPHRGIEDREKGAVLLLALAYIVAVSVIVGALAYWATNDLKNTTNFSTASQQVYAANAATEVAIQAIRSTPDPYYPSPVLTPASGTVTVTALITTGALTIRRLVNAGLLEPPGPYIVGLNWSGFDDRVVHDGGEPQGQRWRERNPGGDVLHVSQHRVDRSPVRTSAAGDGRCLL